MTDAEWMKFLLELLSFEPTDEEAMELAEELWGEDKQEEKEG